MKKECTVFLTSKWDGFLLSFCHLQHCQPLNLQLLFWQLGLRLGREERPNVVEALVQVVAEVALRRSEAGDLFKACEQQQAVSPNQKRSENKGEKSNKIRGVSLQFGT